MPRVWWRSVTMYGVIHISLGHIIDQVRILGISNHLFIFTFYFPIHCYIKYIFDVVIFSVLKGDTDHNENITTTITYVATVHSQNQQTPDNRFPCAHFPVSLYLSK